MCLHLDAVMCWVHANREMDFFDVKSTVGHLQSRGMRHGSRMSPKHTLCGHGAHAVCLGRFWKGAHALRPTTSVRFEQKSLYSFFSTTTLILGRLNALDVNFTSPRHSPPCSSLSGGLDARTAPRGLLHLVMGEPIAPRASCLHLQEASAPSDRARPCGTFGNCRVRPGGRGQG